MIKDKVYTVFANDTAFVRVIGKGTFQNSHPIKRRLLEKIETGCRNILIDLSECVSMDSTFMGIVTGVSIRMKGLGREPVTLVNISAHNVRLLETLGLDKFINLKEKYDLDSSLNWEVLPIESLDKLAVTKHMLEAHEQLIDTGGVVGKQFKSVHKLLKEDLERQTNKKNNNV